MIMGTRLFVYVHKHMQAFIHTFIHTLIHSFTHAQTHARTHTHTQPTDLAVSKTVSRMWTTS